MWLSRETGTEYRLRSEPEWGPVCCRASARLATSTERPREARARSAPTAQSGRTVGHGVECREWTFGLRAGRLRVPCGPRPGLGL